MYLLRLDDASEYMNIKSWDKMEKVLCKYNIKPIFGIIPKSQDIELMKYEKDPIFMDRVHKWIKLGWMPALHGYTHVFETQEGGINPVNQKSEFAGVSYEKQCEKIKKGIEILYKNNIYPKVFFAPAHTFDDNTIKALISQTDIRVISDTIAHDIYYDKDVYFVPQQSGRCRKLPFKTTTFCYHPNIMSKVDFDTLDSFLNKNRNKFVSMSELSLKRRKKTVLDNVLNWLYFLKR